jgi:hypothetical protein
MQYLGIKSARVLFFNCQPQNQANAMYECGKKSTTLFCVVFIACILASFQWSSSLVDQNWLMLIGMSPISKYSWSISHNLGTWISLFEQLRAIRKKSGFEFFWATFEGGLLNFLRAKTFFEFFWKYGSVPTKKVHKIKYFF